MPENPPTPLRNARQQRLECLVDRWLALYERLIALAETDADAWCADCAPKVPELLKGTELANLMRACRLARDLDAADRQPMDDAPDADGPLRFDPDLLAGGIPGDPGAD